MRWFNKWVISFLLMTLIAVLFVFGINFVVDPYGAFGDKIFKWYSYSMIKNPRIGKLNYLDKYYENYDSYVIGGYNSGVLLPELLNKYADAKFYNMMINNGDFYDYEMIFDYILQNYSAKNILLNMTPRELTEYSIKRNIDTQIPAKATEKPAALYYLTYLKADLKHSIEKLAGFVRKRFNPLEYGYIIEKTGVYDKSYRGAEFMGTVDEFLAINSVFSEPVPKSDCMHADYVLESLKRIKNKCDQNEINFILVVGATYETEMDSFDKEAYRNFLNETAKITDYWDFSGYNSVSCNPRNFYDQYHYTYNVGEMIIKKIYDDGNTTVPKDFGFFVTKENVNVYLKYKPRNNGKY